MQKFLNATQLIFNGDNNMKRILFVLLIGMLLLSACKTESPAIKTGDTDSREDVAENDNGMMDDNDRMMNNEDNGMMSGSFTNIKSVMMAGVPY